MNQKRFEEIKKKTAFAPSGGVVKLTVGELVALAKVSQNPVLLSASAGLDDPSYADGEVYPQAVDVAAACEAIEKASQDEPGPPKVRDSSPTVSDASPTVNNAPPTSNEPSAASSPLASASVTSEPDPLTQETDVLKPQSND